MRTSHFIFMLLLTVLPVSAQKTPRHTVCGYVRDSLSAESLNGASVYNQITMAGTCVKQFGFYRLRLPEGKVELVYSHVGYNEQIISFDLQRDTVIDVSLVESTCLQEIAVGDDKACIQETAPMSATSLSVAHDKSWEYTSHEQFQFFNSPLPKLYHAPESVFGRNINPLFWE